MLMEEMNSVVAPVDAYLATEPVVIGVAVLIVLGAITLC